MAWVSRHRLASAVSEAGGLGVLGAATMEPAELRSEIALTRECTSRPFGVNVPLLCLRPDGSDVTTELISIVIEERIPVVITGAGSPARYTAELQRAGCTVLHVVPSPKLALKAEAAGVDAVVAESLEAGGHVRDGGLGTFSLVPQVVDAVSCPVIAAGGIADARGVLAAFALGAHGVQMGTRFVATLECEAHPAYKDALVGAGSEDALLYCRSQHASRGLATPVVRELIELERIGARPEDLQAVRGRHRAQLGCIEGDIEEGLCPAGSGVGMVDEVLSVEELLTRIVDEVGSLMNALERGFDERCRS